MSDAIKAAVLAVLDNLSDRRGFRLLGELRRYDKEVWDDIVATTTRNALTALTSAGYVVVPVEPTEAMRVAGQNAIVNNEWSDAQPGELQDAIAAYRAMIAAREDGK